MTITKAMFDEWAASEDGKRMLQPIFDARVSQAIATFKTNHPSAEELGPRLAALEEAAEKREAELVRVTLDNALYKRCQENGVPYDLLKDFPFTSEEEVNAKVELFQKSIGDVRARERNALLASSPKPGSGVGADRDSRPVGSMSAEELQHLENAGLLNDLLAKQ